MWIPSHLRGIVMNGPDSAVVIGSGTGAMTFVRRSGRLE
jgi:hypothetical protein